MHNHKDLLGGVVLIGRWHPERALAALPGWAFGPAYGVAWALALPWVAMGYTPFIYFQF